MVSQCRCPWSWSRVSRSDVIVCRNPRAWSRVTATQLEAMSLKAEAPEYISRPDFQVTKCPSRLVVQVATSSPSRWVNLVKESCRYHRFSQPRLGVKLTNCLESNSLTVTCSWIHWLRLEVEFADYNLESNSSTATWSRTRHHELAWSDVRIAPWIGYGHIGSICWLNISAIKLN